MKEEIVIPFYFEDERGRRTEDSNGRRYTKFDRFITKVKDLFSNSKIKTNINIGGADINIEYGLEEDHKNE